MAQELQQNLRQGQHLTLKQIRFVRLLELNAPELDEAVEKELEANPALEPIEPSQDEEKELDDTTPYYLRRSYNNSPDSAQYDFSPADTSDSLYDYLERQIDEKSLPHDVAATAKYIIGNLDSNGYLQRPIAGIVDDLAFNHDIIIDPQTAKEALIEVQQLDPPGVGGENLRETLLLQLERMPQSQTRDDAITILRDYFEPFSMRHSHKILSGLKISRDRLQAANQLILTLNPKPGAPFGGNARTEAGIIIPDFIVTREGNDLNITLNNRIPELAIEESFSEAMRGVERRRGRPKKGTEFISSRYNDAKDFIQVLRQRQETMLSVMTAIIKWQKEYFETGDLYSLRPMMIRDLSGITGLDPSVISRATTNKFVDTPWGAIIPLRSLFSDTVNQSEKADAYPAATGENNSQPTPSRGDSPGHTNKRNNTDRDNSAPDNLTNRQIEALISKIVEEEDKRHPLSDEKIKQLLAKEGYDISRRTIAKYRDRQGILVARLRKAL